MTGIKIGKYKIGWKVIILVAITAVVIYLMFQSGGTSVIGPFDSWKVFSGVK